MLPLVKNSCSQNSTLNHLNMPGLEGLIELKRDHFIWKLISQSSHLHFPIFQRKEIHIATLFKNANTVLSPPSNSTQKQQALLSSFILKTHSFPSISQSERVPMEHCS